MRVLLIFVSVAAFVCAVLWYASEPAWEPLVASLGALAVVIGLFAVGDRHSGGKSDAPSVLARLTCALRKFFFPVTDAGTGLTQSRMRYYLVQFRYANGDRPVAYQEVDSNGNVQRYLRTNGERLIPKEPNECSVIGDRRFKFPGFGRIDWRDVFNGDAKSGLWGISNP